MVEPFAWVLWCREWQRVSVEDDCDCFVYNARKTGVTPLYVAGDGIERLWT